MCTSICKRMMGILLTATLVLSMASVVAGCFGGAEPDVPKDFGGRTFKIDAAWTGAPVEGRSTWDDAFAERIREIEQSTNCKIEFVSVEDAAQTYVTTILSGQPVCDIGVIESYHLLPGLIRGGIAYPLSDLSAFDFTEEKWSPIATDFGAYKGKTYTMEVKSTPTNVLGSGVFYNKRIFAEQQLPDPAELYADGAWTWEKMLEIAESIQPVADDDELYPYTVGGEGLMWNFIISNGGNVFIDDDGKIRETAFEDPKVTQAMDVCAEFYSKLDGSLFPYDCTIPFQNAILAMGVMDWQTAETFCATADTPMADDYGFVPFPAGPSAEGVYYSYKKEMPLCFMANTDQAPEDIAWVFNAITDCAENDDQWNDWLSSTVETWAADTQTADTVMAMIEAETTVLNPLVGHTDLHLVAQTMFEQVARGELTTEDALATYSQQLETAIKYANERQYDPTGWPPQEPDPDHIYPETEFGSLTNDGSWTATAQYYTEQEPWFEVFDAPAMVDGNADTAYTFTRTHTVNDMITVNFGKTEALRKIFIDHAGDKTYPTNLKVQYKDEPEGEWRDVVTEVTYGKTTEIVLGKNLEACEILVQIQMADVNRIWDIAELRFEYVSKQNAPTYGIY